MLFLEKERVTAGRVLGSGRDFPLYKASSARETLLGELEVAGLDFDTEIRTSGEDGCDESAAGPGNGSSKLCGL